MDISLFCDYIYTLLKMDVKKEKERKTCRVISCFCLMLGFIAFIMAMTIKRRGCYSLLLVFLPVKGNNPF